MKEWFMSDPLRAVLLLVAVPSTLIMLIQTILVFIGMAGGDADVDMPDDKHRDIQRFCGSHEHVGALPHLGHASRRGAEL